jgi:hypothetical protein
VAIACLAADTENAGEKLARRGYALIEGSGVELAAAVAAFDALRAGDESVRMPPAHSLVAALLSRPAVRDLVTEAVGPGAKAVRAVATDRQNNAGSFEPWHQAPAAADSLLARGLVLRWHLDLIGPADGGLRVLPGSHTKGRLTAEQVALLAKETPAVELPVCTDSVLALRPLLVHGSRRRATQGHRRILHVELAAGAPPPLEWAWA